MENTATSSVSTNIIPPPPPPAQQTSQNSSTAATTSSVMGPPQPHQVVTGPPGLVPNSSSSLGVMSAGNAVSLAANALGGGFGPLNHNSSSAFRKPMPSGASSGVGGSSGGAKYFSDITSSPSALPSSIQKKLNHSFRDLEKEFEALYLENMRLRQKIALLEKGHHQGSNYDAGGGGGSGGGFDDKLVTEETMDAFENVLKSFTKKNAFKTRHKLKAHTSKIVSSFKPPLLSCTLVKEFRGHRDGIWDIALTTPLNNQLCLGTASADKTARIWCADSGRCMLRYTGHSGSVNSISFHPSKDLAMTASGDGTAHLWKTTALFTTVGGGPGASTSEYQSDANDSIAESSEDDGLGGLQFGGRRNTRANPVSMSGGCGLTVKQPSLQLAGHQNVVIGCRWLDSDHAVTASWDRTANLYNVEAGVLTQSLTGHDAELTHVACHPTQKLVATCSQDTTFRLWDFRETIHSVSVFQGHTDAVTCAEFSRSDQIVSGSDDRSVKVWDLRNMRAPLTTIHTPSAVNKLSISHGGLLAIPQDNRNVTLYDLNGQKLVRLPRESAKSHTRMVSAAAWSPIPAYSADNPTRPNLFSAGFDRLALGWCIRDREDFSNNNNNVNSSGSVGGASGLPQSGAGIVSSIPDGGSGGGRMGSAIGGGSGRGKRESTL